VSRIGKLCRSFHLYYCYCLKISKPFEKPTLWGAAFAPFSYSFPRLLSTISCFDGILKCFPFVLILNKVPVSSYSCLSSFIASIVLFINFSFFLYVFTSWLSALILCPSGLPILFLKGKKLMKCALFHLSCCLSGASDQLSGNRLFIFISQRDENDSVLSYNPDVMKWFVSLIVVCVLLCRVFGLFWVCGLFFFFFW